MKTKTRHPLDTLGLGELRKLVSLMLPCITLQSTLEDDDGRRIPVLLPLPTNTDSLLELFPKHWSIELRRTYDGKSCKAEARSLQMPRPADHQKLEWYPCQMNEALLSILYLVLLAENDRNEKKK